MTTKRPTDPIALAEQALVAIGERKAEAIARRDDLLEQAGDLGFKAYGDGDLAAQQKIRTLSQEAAAVENELTALGAAAVEAHRRLAAARREAEREVIRAKAAVALQQVGELHAEGARCGNLLDQFLESYDRIIAVSNGIRATGVGKFPTGELFTLSVRNSLQAAMLPRHLNGEPVLVAVANRRSLAAVLERFTSELQFSLERRLEDGPEIEPADLDDEAAQ